MERRDYWYLLAVTEELGAAAVKKLIAQCGSPEEIFRAKHLPLSEKQQAAFDEAKKRQAELLKERDGFAGKGIRWCCTEDAEYPRRLLSIPDPPTVLFYRGSLPPEEEKTAAVIGARRCSFYGRSLAERFGRELAEAGVSVVSGMAMGIDGFAQAAAVGAGGRSFAVLGCGPDLAYPAINRPLYEKLLTQGGVISEYKPGTEPLPYHFPLRNRIISGLADVLLVIEARAVSGSLITVDQALEQGRDVLALPGRIGDPLSEGCNSLIRQGAGILTCTEDVLQLLGMAAPEEADKKDGEDGGKAAADPAGQKKKAPSARREKALSPAEKAVFRTLSHDPVHLEEMMKQTGFSLGEISLVLLSLEESGLVRPVSGGQYVRTS